jgi:PAS domain S-box-containing protein
MFRRTSSFASSVSAGLGGTVQQQRPDMDTQQEDSAREIKRLQRCISDLLSLFALPAIWSGNKPSQIIESLLDALMRLLPLDLVYIHLRDAASELGLEAARVSQSDDPMPEPDSICKILRNQFGDGADVFPSVIRMAIGAQDIGLLPLQVGLHGEIGLLVAGSRRTRFPEQTEKLVLSVAANQAAISLQEARILANQEKVAIELDERVSQRTRQLANINEELRNEIAERKQVEERLSRSDERWRSVFENSAIGVAITDLNGRFIATNPVYEKMLGYSDQELRQLTFMDVTHEEDREHNRALIVELIEGKRQQFEIEKQYWRKDGKSVWVKNNVAIVPGTERVPQFLMALSEDITKRKHAEEALGMARSELTKVARVTTLGVLTASIAHEVNQPLSGILTNASTCLRMLSADPPNIEGAIETARRTIRDGNRASDVITRLRALYSKKEASPESMDLNEATREVTTLSSSELQRNGVMLRLDLAGDLPSMVGDRIQLQQVILNMVRNAADAMSTVEDRPKELLIRTERDGSDRVRLSVRDAGVGLVRQDADKLFQAFYTTKDDGMGIGLSISRSIIEMHEGSLWAAANDGPGATFGFSIPCRPAAFAGAENPTGQTSRAVDAA